MYYIAICDDDREFLVELREHLRKYEAETGRDFHISEFRDGSALLDGYETDFDLIFLDIKMAEMDGLKTAEELRKRDKEAGLFFLTSLPQYVWKGYEYNALNYLLKPIRYGRLKMELDRFFARWQGREEPCISFSNDAGKYKVPYKNLRYAETSRRNVLFHFGDQSQVVYKSMKEVAALLETRRQFARCHASFIVNMAYIKSVENLTAVLTTGEHIPISQPKRKEFMAKLADFWGDML